MLLNKNSSRATQAITENVVFIQTIPLSCYGGHIYTALQQRLFYSKTGLKFDSVHDRFTPSSIQSHFTQIPMHTKRSHTMLQLNYCCRSISTASNPNSIFFHKRTATTWNQRCALLQSWYQCRFSWESIQHALLVWGMRGIGGLLE